MSVISEDLDKYQLSVLNNFEANNNLAVLGGAGTGKSFILSKIIALARERHGGEHVAACAVTNNAAHNIGGMTLHRLFKAKINWEWSAEGLWDSLQSRLSSQRRLRDIHVLIIDEISTVKASILNAIDNVLRRLPRTPAQHDEPFGGRQIVVSGDPFQLEPFFDIAERNTASAFQSSPRRQTFGTSGSGKIVLLSKNHRQAADDRFFSILSRVRQGRQTDQDVLLLNNSCESSADPPKSHTRLVLTNEEAAEINADALEMIDGALFKMRACDTIFTRNNFLQRQAHSRLIHAAPKMIVSKKGARVLLTSKHGCLYPGTEMLVLQI